MLVNRDINKLSVALGFSSMSSSLLGFTLPFYVYSEKESAIYTSLVVTCSAVGSLFAAYHAKNLNFLKSDKLNVILNELLMVFLLLAIFILSGNSFFLIFIFITSFVESLLITARSGYFESLIGHIASNSNGSNRQSLIGRTKLFQNLGLVIGFSIAAPLTIGLSERTVFLFALCLNLISILFMSFLAVSGELNMNRRVRRSSFYLLFGGRIKYLSISHGVNAVALFMYNGTLVFFLKDFFDASNYLVSLYFILTMLGSMLGSALIMKLSKERPIQKNTTHFFRFGYFVCFVLISVSYSYYSFLFGTMLLCVLHAFSIPVWQDLFQTESNEDTWRIVGTTRKALVSCCGIVGSLVGGILAENYGLSITFFLAAVLSFISWVVLRMYLQQRVLTNEVF